MVKKFLRITCLAVAGCLLLASMAGCGKGKADAGEQTESAEKSASADAGGNDRESSAQASGEESKPKENKFPDRANATEGTGKVKTLEAGDVAPDFTAKLTDGSTFTLSDYDDKVVILNFFATWCGPCMREMPAFEKLKADERADLAILCVDCSEDTKVVDRFVKDNGYTFPIAYDVDDVIGKYYPSDGIPYTLIIDQGVIAKIYLGARDAETQYKEYKGAIDECLGR